MFLKFYIFPIGFYGCFVLGSVLGYTINMINENILNQLKLLPQTEKLILIKLLLNSEPDKQDTHSLTELAGLGKEIWQDVKPEDYIQKERDNWK